MSPTGRPGPDEHLPIRPYLQTPPTNFQVPDQLTDQGQPGTPPGSPKLRPFVLTAGRVAAEDPDLGLETQVTAQGRGSRIPTARLSPELRAIVNLCDEPISIAEISARLKLHLGVVKILVSDLRATGHLDVHNRDVSSQNTPELILRVIRGLSAIT